MAEEIRYWHGKCKAGVSIDVVTEGEHKSDLDPMPLQCPVHDDEEILLQRVSQEEYEKNIEDDYDDIEDEEAEG